MLVPLLVFGVGGAWICRLGWILAGSLQVPDFVISKLCCRMATPLVHSFTNWSGESSPILSSSVAFVREATDALYIKCSSDIIKRLYQTTLSNESIIRLSKKQIFYFNSTRYFTNRYALRPANKKYPVPGTVEGAEFQTDLGFCGWEGEQI